MRGTEVNKDTMETRNKNRHIGMIAAMLVAMAAMSITLVALPNKFTTFRGIVTLNGANAPTDLLVVACVDETRGGANITYDAVGSTWYIMDVTNGTNGDSVVFRVDGLLANEVGTYNDAPESVVHDLTVNQSEHTLELAEGWNLISFPVELKYDGCIHIV